MAIDVKTLELYNYLSMLRGYLFYDAVLGIKKWIVKEVSLKDIASLKPETFALVKSCFEEDFEYLYESLKIMNRNNLLKVISKCDLLIAKLEFTYKEATCDHEKTVAILSLERILEIKTRAVRFYKSRERALA